MSIQGVGNNLSSLNPYQTSSAGVSGLLGKTVDASELNGITDVDSYVSNSLDSSQIDPTYSSAVQTNPLNISNLASALNAVTATADLNGISDVGEYAKEALSKSQLTETDQLSEMEAVAGSPGSMANLDGSVNIAYEEVENNLIPGNVSFSNITDMGAYLDSFYNSYKSLAAKSQADESTGQTVDTQV